MKSMQNMSIAHQRGLEGKPCPKWAVKGSLVHKSWQEGRDKRKHSKRRAYMGVFFWWDIDTKKWYCEAFSMPTEEPFDTLADVKAYIKDFMTAE